MEKGIPMLHSRDFALEAVANHIITAPSAQIDFPALVAKMRVMKP